MELPKRRDFVGGIEEEQANEFGMLDGSNERSHHPEDESRE
jgi:hypothetical protein